MSAGNDDLRCAPGDGYPPHDDLDTNVRVGTVQGLLHTRFGAPSLSEDDYYGPLTQTAVKGFQHANGLPETGNVDAATSDMLQNENAQPIGSPPASILPSAKTTSMAAKVIGGLAVGGGLTYGGYRALKHFGVL